MSKGYQIRDQVAPYSLTLTVVDLIEVFTRKAYKDIVIESLEYCQGLEMYGYVMFQPLKPLKSENKENNFIHLINLRKVFVY
jgi:hypothetical protein